MNKLIVARFVLASTIASAGYAQEVVQWAAPVVASSAAPQPTYFPMGTPIQLTTRTELNTKYNHAGDRFYLEVAEPLVYRGQVIVPVGSVAVGEVMRAERNGHFGKKGQLDVRLSYVQTPSGPVRLSGRVGRSGTGQGILSIGGAALIAWPMVFIHGTSGRLPADTAITAYLADDLMFNARPNVVQTLANPDNGRQAARALPARFDPSVFTSNRPN